MSAEELASLRQETRVSFSMEHWDELQYLEEGTGYAWYCQALSVDELCTVVRAALRPG